MAVAVLLITWILKLSAVLLIVAWVVNRFFDARIILDGGEVVVRVQNATYIYLKASNLKVSVALLELRIPNYLTSQPVRGHRRRPFIVTQDVHISYQSTSGTASSSQSPGLYMVHFATWLLSCLKAIICAPITVKTFSFDYHGARGNLKLTVDEVCGDVTLGSSLSVTISEAKGTLASGGINVARYHCNSLVLKALLNHNNVEMTLRGECLGVELSSSGMTKLADSGAINIATCAEEAGGMQLAESRAIDGGSDKVVAKAKGFFIVASPEFCLQYTDTATSVKIDRASVQFNMLDYLSQLNLKGGPTLLESAKQRRANSESMSIVPLEVANVLLCLHYGKAGVASAAPLPGDDFEMVETADGLAAHAATSSFPSVIEPSASDSSAAGTTATAAAATGADSAMTLKMTEVIVTVQQQEKSFEQMSSVAGQLLSDAKAIFAIQGSQGESSSSGTLSTVDVVVTKVSISIDRSTAKAATVTYGNAAGLLAQTVDIKIVTVLPVISCTMDSFNWRSGGAMAVKELVFEAGRLGSLVLFKLNAQGLGYTRDAQEMVLATWSSEVANIKAIGGKHWSGTLTESTDKTTGAGAQSVVRQVMVPPGVQLTQVFRLAPAVPAATLKTKPIQKGIVTLRALDVNAAKMPAADGSSSLEFPPAGFGLDFLPGYKAGFCVDFAVQPCVPSLKLLTPEQGMSMVAAATAGIFKAFRR